MKPLEQDPTRACFFNPLTDSPTLLYGDIFDVYLDPESTPPSIFTCTKTTKREMYNSARERAKLAPLAPSSPGRPVPSEEVLIHNERQHITEGSFTNFAVYRSRRWVTPSADSGCLPGVMRRWIVEQGRVYEASEETFNRESLRQDEWLLLFNGVI